MIRAQCRQRALAACKSESPAVSEPTGERQPRKSRDRAADNCGPMAHFRFQKMQVLADDKFPIPELDRCKKAFALQTRKVAPSLGDFCLDMRQVRPRSSNQGNPLSIGSDRKAHPLDTMEPRGQPFRFVNIENPTTTDQKTRRQVRAHAARETHARARRTRVINHLHLSGSHIQTAEATELHRSGTKDTRNVSAVGGAAEEEAEPAPNPTSILSSARQDPFAVAARSLNPVEHFLLDHCKFGPHSSMLPRIDAMAWYLDVKVVIPAATITCQALKNSGQSRFYGHRMTVDWVPSALADTGLLSGLLLNACRFLAESSDGHQRERYATMAIQYKVSCLRSLNQALAAESSAPTDMSLAKVMALVSDDVIPNHLPPALLTDEGSPCFQIGLGDLEASRKHVLGAIKIVDIRGGPRSLGMNGLLEFILLRLVYDKGLFKQRPSHGCWNTYSASELLSRG